MKDWSDDQLFDRAIEISWQIKHAKQRGYETAVRIKTQVLEDLISHITFRIEIDCENLGKMG